MSDVQIRAFRGDDLPAVAALYARTLGPKHPRYCWPLNVDRLKRQYFGHPEYREDGLFVAERMGMIAGFAFGAVRMHPITSSDDITPAYLSLLLVDEACRRRGIGTQLLERVAEFGRRCGKTVLNAHANPLNPVAFWPGVNRGWSEIVGFLQHHGFEVSEVAISVDQRLDHFEYSERVVKRRAELEKNDFRVIPYEPRFHDTLLETAAGFIANWDLDMRSKIVRIENPFIETAFLDLDRDNIYGPDDVTLAVCGDELAGYVAMARNPGETISFLGPIHVIKKYEGMGLGSVMIQTALMAERARGIELVDLWCTRKNAERFYFPNGFVQCDTWDQYGKPL
jgi:GNAT superfamily N-acetyltransferase